MLGKLFGRTRKTNLPKTLTYEDARSVLETGEREKLASLAKRTDTRPEMLYYLAQEGTDNVRAQVASNPSTPMQANELLADDDVDEVREELARKITRLLPDMEDEAREEVRQRTFALLDKLAQDQLPKVRAIIAEEIKRNPNVPKSLVSRLARDMEAIVCVPILSYSPLLSDDDLKEVIAAGTVQEALSAIATRPSLSDDVAEAVVATLDVPAVAALLANKSAHIREETLDAIIDGAPNVTAWHEPLALRNSMSLRAIKRIAGFVASSLVASMVERNEIEDNIAEEILDNARKRISDEDIGDKQEAAFAHEAKMLAQAGGIDDEFILDAIRNNRRSLIIHCLAQLTELDVQIVRDIMSSKSGRTVTALAWKAGLAMRTAYALQKSVALVPPPQMLHAKDGVDYPVTPGELAWQLDAFICG